MSTQDNTLMQVWDEYRNKLRVFTKNLRDARVAIRDIREMSEMELNQTLTERKINTGGIRVVREERLWRADLRRILPYEDIPWYPEYDEAGGADIPFVEAGLLVNLEERVTQLATKKKRGPKPSRTEESGGETEAAEEGEAAERYSDLDARLAVPIHIPTVMSLTTTTSTVTVTTSARPISHPMVANPLASHYKPPTDIRTLSRDYPSLEPWACGNECVTHAESWRTARAQTPMPRSTVLTPHLGNSAIEKARRPRLSNILERGEDEVEIPHRDERLRFEEGSSRPEERRRSSQPSYRIESETDKRSKTYRRNENSRNEKKKTTSRKTEKTKRTKSTKKDKRRRRIASDSRNSENTTNEESSSEESRSESSESWSEENDSDESRSSSDDSSGEEVR